MPQWSKRPRYGLLGASAIAIMAWSPASQAQTGDTGPREQTDVSEAGVGDIVVTATKIGQSTVLNTPITMQALGDEALKRRGATEFADFSALIPGLVVNDSGPGRKRLILRGIDSDGAGTVAVYLDEIPITDDSTSAGARQIDPRLFDIERIEVLKGPQGTTFGSGSMTGAVRYITNKPNVTEFGGSARIGLTNQSGTEGFGTNFDATVNLPLVQDTLALRIGGFGQRRPGYIDNRYEKGVNSEDTWASRVQLRWKAGERATLDLFGSYQHTRAGFQYFNLTDVYRVPVRPLYQSNLERLGTKDRTRLLNATFTYDLDFGTLTATASDIRQKTDAKQPASQVLAAVARISDPETLGVQSNLIQPQDRRVQSAELRFASQWAAPVQLLAGVFYKREKRDYASTVLTVNDLGYVDPASGVLYGPNLLDRTNYTGVKEQAIFGDATWNVTDQFSLNVGVRAFHFDTESQGGVRKGVLGTPGTGLGPLIKGREESATWKVNASYHVDPQTMLYATVATGYRPGGTNDPTAASLGGVTIPSSYKSDNLRNHEVGIKYGNSDRSFTATAAAYYIKWTDMQLTLITPITPQFQTRYSYKGNAGRTAAYGGEVELHARPVDGLELGLTGSFTRAVLKVNVDGGGLRGDTIPGTAKWKFSLSGDYRFPLSDRLEGFIGADANYLSQRATSYPSLTTNYVVLPAYTTVNARVGVNIDRLRLSVIGRNLFNDDTITDVFIQSPPRTLNGYFRNPPRSVSLEAAIAF